MKQKRTEGIEQSQQGGQDCKIKQIVDLSEQNDLYMLTIKSLFLRIAEMEIKKPYVINENNKGLISDLFSYFLGSNGLLDLNKGILLSGNFGCGKSTLFASMRKFINQIEPFNKNGFAITSIENIIKEQNLIESVYLFNTQMRENKPKHLLVNEFGHDYKIKNFGSDSKDIEESFLMKRYDIFQSYGKVTHFTTNLSADEIRNKYPPVIVDRLKEMCNVISLDGGSFRI